ncbi:DUF222 domain-containing protein [Desertimonas flava]|uniref:DUF222 domain-containing protein n=1 Tax=Desertimonas flava TaxID=2064846 RepID=UPI000E3444D4|nr:DUF222 domain-containing protein [Desertimonas flava]
MWHSTDLPTAGAAYAAAPPLQPEPPAPPGPPGPWRSPLPACDRVLVDRLSDVLDVIVAMGPASATDGQIGQVTLLERIINAAAGLRAEVSVAFADATIDEHRDQGVSARWVGRGVSDELGLARRVSPQHAAADMRLARQLDVRFPILGRLLRVGDVSERVAAVVARECQHLNDELAHRVDTELSRQLVGLGVGKAEAAARYLAIGLDEAGFLERHTRAAEQRGVSMRPVADGMVRISGLVPMRDGVAAYGTLDRAARDARSNGDERPLDHLRADLFVDLLSGRRTRPGVNIEFNITIPAESLLGNDTAPGVIPGYGPIPATWARELLDTIAHQPDTADTNTTSGTGVAVWLRRVFTDPADDTVSAVDQHRRRFHPHVARWIRARDANICRMPVCDRDHDLDLDHVDPYRHSHDSAVANGQLACQSYNQIKELPGWTVTKHPDRDRPNAPMLTITTPTGRTYTAPTPPVFGPGTRRTSAR